MVGLLCVRAAGVVVALCADSAVERYRIDDICSHDGGSALREITDGFAYLASVSP